MSTIERCAAEVEVVRAVADPKASGDYEREVGGGGRGDRGTDKAGGGNTKRAGKKRGSM